MIDVVLYISGGEGLLTLQTTHGCAKVIKIVLPSGIDNHDILSFAHNNNIPITYRDALNGVKLSDCGNAFLLSSAFPYKIFPEEVESVASAINFHAAILPKYRGRHGAVWAMINDEPELGVTAHHIDNGFDSGQIIAIDKFGVTDEMTLADIHKQSLDSLQKLVKKIVTEDARNTEQGSPENIYWRARSTEDGRINWHVPARTVFLLVRALAREPVYAWSQYNKHKFLFDAVELTTETHNRLPGSVFEKDGYFYVCTGASQVVRILKYHGSVLKSGMVLH